MYSSPEASTVSEQVERVLDEGAGATRQVLVRMQGPETARDPSLRAAAYRALQRSLSTTPRELLPDEILAEAAGGKEAASKKRAEESRFGVSASIGSVTRSQLRRTARQSLRPILNSTVVSRHGETATKGALATFDAARTVLLELPMDDLAQVANMEGVADVYPNRALRVPHIIEAKRLPANVIDEKTAAWGINAIGALAAWGAYGVRGRHVKVGVLDTGVDPDHPDLTGKVDDWAEFDAQGTTVNGSTPHDSDRHGTHVCGTIAGGDASGQWIGVAPNASLAVGLVLNGDNGGTDAQVLAGIDWALFEAGVHVINMSLGGLTIGPDVPSIYTEAILSCNQRGVPVITAIGNEGSQTTGSPGNDFLSFAVGATDYEDRAAGFSGGRTQIVRTSTIIPPEYLPLPYSKPDLSAPGVAVRSAVPGGDWVAFNGTSMATPHVAGAVALLLSATTIRRDVDAADRAFYIQDLLAGSVEELGESGQDHRFGFGRLDVLRAIGFAKSHGL